MATSAFCVNQRMIAMTSDRLVAPNDVTVNRFVSGSTDFHRIDVGSTHNLTSPWPSACSAVKIGLVYG